MHKILLITAPTTNQSKFQTCPFTISEFLPHPRYSFHSTCIVEAVVDVPQCMNRLFMRVKYRRRLRFLLVIAKAVVRDTWSEKAHCDALTLC